MSLWRFDEVPEQISEDFIADNDKLLTQLKRIDLSSSFPGIGSYTMTNGPRVNTAQPPGPAKIPTEANGHPNTKHINDAIYAAAEQLQDRPRERRKIIFLISDGQNAKNNTHKYDETLKLLLSDDISVYAVGVGEANLNRGITFLGNNILVEVRAFDRRRYFLRRHEPGKPRRTVRARFRTGAQPVHHRLLRRAYRPLQAVSQRLKCA